ncbi:MAG: hypothetical protein EBQ87_02465 [Planctomycetes bacterium]|nr:hypothetical protein [Planctomycetota bacterium]
MGLGVCILKAHGLRSMGLLLLWLLLKRPTQRSAWAWKIKLKSAWAWKIKLKSAWGWVFLFIILFSA